MSNKQQLAFDRSDRERSLAMLDRIQAGVAMTARSTAEMKAIQSIPQVGDIIAAPRAQLGALLTEFFVTVEFARDMVEQLQALEKLTGQRADTLNIHRYEGVTIPRGVEEVVVDDNTLYAVVRVASSLAPGHTVPARHPLAIANEPTATGEVFTLDQLQKAAKAFAVAHPKETVQ